MTKINIGTLLSQRSNHKLNLLPLPRSYLRKGRDLGLNFRIFLQIYELSVGIGTYQKFISLRTMTKLDQYKE